MILRGLATYSQAGASLGFATLWTAVVNFPSDGSRPVPLRKDRDGKWNGFSGRAAQALFRARCSIQLFLGW